MLVPSLLSILNILQEHLSKGYARIAEMLSGKLEDDLQSAIDFFHIFRG